MKYKIINTLAIIVLFISINLCFYINSFAVGTTKVLTVNDNIEQLSEREYLIPVYISGNEGIMGFRIEFIYDKEQLDIDYIVKGGVTGKGSFDSNIDVSGKWGRASALWYYTENVTEDGSIIYIKIRTKGDYQSRTIRIGYSEEDTFNESWESVSLICKNIVIEGNTEQASEGEELVEAKPDGVEIEESDASDKSIENITSEDIVKQIGEVTDTNQINVSEGTIVLSNDVGTSEEEKAVVEKLDTSLENSIKESAKVEGSYYSIPDELGIEAVVPYIKEELKVRGYLMISDIPDVEKDEFWIVVKNNYINDHEEMRDIMNDVDLSPIGEIEDISVEKEINKETGNRHLIIIICTLVLFILIIFLLYKKTKRGKEGKE